MYLPKPLSSTPTSYLDDTIGVHSLWAAMFSADKYTAVRHTLSKPSDPYKAPSTRASLPSSHVRPTENASRTTVLYVSTSHSPRAEDLVSKCRRPSGALGPGPPVWEGKLSRVLRAPSSAPNSAQAGVIDAERPRQDHANGSSPRLRSRVQGDRALAVQSTTSTEP